MTQHLLFADKGNRDAKYASLRKSANVLEVRRNSIRNQQIHPMYVEDRKDGLSAADCGFGNTIYKTYFPVLYSVEWEWV